MAIFMVKAWGCSSLTTEPSAFSEAAGDRWRADLAAMPLDQLLAEARGAGLRLEPNGQMLRVRGPKEAEGDLVRALLARKAEIISRLPVKCSAEDQAASGSVATASVPSPEAQTPAPTSITSWDAAEADRLVTDLRDRLAAIERAHFGRAGVPRALRNVLDAYLEVAGDLIANHEMEVCRGWDPMALLRGTIASAIELAEREAKNQPRFGGRP
jgi:hypothetical protein